jgi:hypothetical protein
MLKQHQRGKTSSTVKPLESKLGTARVDTLDAMEISLQANLSDLAAVIEKQLAKLRQGLLVELANSHENLARFRTKLAGRFQPEADAMYVSARRDLRAIWSDAISRGQKQQYVDAWLHAALGRPDRAGIWAPLKVGHLILNPLSFPAQFVVAILENSQRFAVCANPECVAPFFLAKRRTQKFCERGECTRYAQNQYALRWWKENKGKRKRKKIERSKGNGTQKTR